VLHCIILQNKFEFMAVLRLCRRLLLAN